MVALSLNRSSISDLRLEKDNGPAESSDGDGGSTIVALNLQASSAWPSATPAAHTTMTAHTMARGKETVGMLLR